MEDMAKAENYDAATRKYWDRIQAETNYNTTHFNQYNNVQNINKRFKTTLVLLSVEDQPDLFKIESESTIPVEKTDFLQCFYHLDFEDIPFPDENFSGSIMNSPDSQAITNGPNLNGVIGEIERSSRQGNIHDFLRGLELAGKLDSWDDDTKVTVCMLKLRGRANEAVDQNQPWTWHALKQRLVTQFSVKVTDHQAMPCDVKKQERVYGIMQLESSRQEARLWRNPAPQRTLTYIQRALKRALHCQFLDAFLVKQQMEVRDLVSAQSGYQRTFLKEEHQLMMKRIDHIVATTKGIIDTTDHQRFKRGMINVGGTVIKFLFGNPDANANDVERIERQFDGMQAVNVEIVHSLKAQATMLNKTYQMLKVNTKTPKEVSLVTQDLQRDIQKLQSDLTQSTKNSFKLIDTSFSIDANFRMLGSVITSIKHNVNQLEIALDTVAQSRLSNAIISALKLKETLAIVEDQLPNNYAFLHAVRMHLPVTSCSMALFRGETKTVAQICQKTSSTIPTETFHRVDGADGHNRWAYSLSCPLKTVIQCLNRNNHSSKNYESRTVQYFQGSGLLPLDKYCYAQIEGRTLLPHSEEMTTVNTTLEKFHFPTHMTVNNKAEPSDDHLEEQIL
ncbi:unnamed protein product [Ceutorhynchus assimilis]|uniref:Uncharacterized protein n=1 Tax=Ceutorhynchus assimilis TaxID=467358 RepID=A0A9N9MYT9_9CUCU|nr:unnamed protein product [Ceutorhynchus assimilis]